MFYSVAAALLALVVVGVPMDLLSQEPEDSTIPGQPPVQPPGLPAPGPFVMTLGYWAQGLQPGQDTIIDGVVLRHLPNVAHGRRVLLAGVPMSAQPTFDLDAIEDTSNSGPHVLDQTRRYGEWAASYYGAALPKNRRLALARLYRRTIDSAAALARAPRDELASANAIRGAIITLLTDHVLAERQIFASTPRAQERRYGRPLAQPLHQPNRERLRRAFTEVLTHEDSQVHRDPYDSAAGRRILGFTSHLPPTGMQLVAAPPHCLLGDTIVQTRADPPEPLSTYEVRIYVASHPAFGDVRGVLQDLGFNVESFVHTSVLGSIWNLRKQHVITLKFFRPCPSGVIALSEGQLRDLVGGSVPVESTKTTTYFFQNVGWRIGNGASGAYEASDLVELVGKASFSSWDDAVRWLYTPTPSPGGHYYKIRAAAYSVGDYGFNFICQTAANAFAVRRWGIDVIPEPAFAFFYGLYGNSFFGDDGITKRKDWMGHVHAGCVPGSGCYFNTTLPYATGIFEGSMDGWGFGLDEYYNPNQSQPWRQTEAAYSNASIPFGLWRDFVTRVSGWQ